MTSARNAPVSPHGDDPARRQFARGRPASSPRPAAGRRAARRPRRARRGRRATSARSRPIGRRAIEGTRAPRTRATWRARSGRTASCSCSTARAAARSARVHGRQAGAGRRRRDRARPPPGANIAAAYGTGLAARSAPARTAAAPATTRSAPAPSARWASSAPATARAGPGRGYGDGRRACSARANAKTPDPILGIASCAGTLDKEIIRRIVRRHLNEVKYCYEQALARQPTLDGRLVVQFTIAGTGQVLASVVQSSTLGSPAVEMCVVNAVKRWEFPRAGEGRAGDRLLPVPVLARRRLASRPRRSAEETPGRGRRYRAWCCPVDALAAGHSPPRRAD